MAQKHINIRISYSGSKAPYSWLPETMHSRIILFTWFVGAQVFGLGPSFSALEEGKSDAVEKPPPPLPYSPTSKHAPYCFHTSAIRDTLPQTNMEPEKGPFKNDSRL